MKKLAKILGILGGAGAVAWAMRDRITSIASPKEPETPNFRVVTPPSTPPASAPSTDQLVNVEGIGPIFAAKLVEAGITTPAELVTAGPSRIAEIVGLPESRVQGWIDHASALVP